LKTCSSPQTYTGLSVGPHTVLVAAIDAVGNITALRAILAAGGFKNTGEVSSVVVLREQPGSAPLFMVVNLEASLGNDPDAADVALEPYDVVFVPKTRIAQVDQFIDQYIRQLIPISLNAGFSWVRQWTLF
jgi:protein involved in polysaccharide export with SLBB domain